MENGFLARPTGRRAGPALVAALLLTVAPGVAAADGGESATGPTPLVQAVERFWAELARPFELLLETATASSETTDSDTTSDDDDDNEVSPLHGPRIDPNG